MEKKLLTFVIAGIFIFSSIPVIGLPVIKVENSNVNEEIMNERMTTATIGATDNEYDWPMFHHDPANTGFSPSEISDELDIKWHQNIYNAFSSPVVSNGKVIIFDLGGSLHALDENTGESIWKCNLAERMTTDKALLGWSSPAVHNGKIYAYISSVFTLVPKSKLFALDEETGDILWEKDVKICSGYVHVTIANDKIFIGGHLSFSIPISILYAFNEQGEMLWQKMFLGFLESTPAVSDDGKIFVTIGAVSGALLNSKKPFSVTGRSLLYALDINDGSTIWTKLIFFGASIVSSPVFVNGKVLAATYVTINIKDKLSFARAKLQAFDAANGDKLWTYGINKPTIAFPTAVSTPSVINGKVFLVTAECRLHVLDENTGELLREISIIDDTIYKVSMPISPPILADGKVVVSALGAYLLPKPTYKFKVCMFDIDTGSLVWDYTWTLDESQEEPVMLASPLVITNEKLFVSAFTEVYVFGEIN